MDQMMEEVQKMRRQKGWDKTDTPAILAKSVSVEAGELLECFQFDEKSFDREAVLSEAADVIMYAASLCEDLGVDYREAVIRKIADVDKRYPDAGK